MLNKKIINITLSLVLVLGVGMVFSGCGKTQQQLQKDAAVTEAKKSMSATDEGGNKLTDEQKNEAANEKVKADTVQALANQYIKDDYSLSYDNTDLVMKDIESIACPETIAQYKKVATRAINNNYKVVMNRADINTVDFQKIDYNGKSYDGVLINATVQYVENGSKVPNPGKTQEDTLTVQAINLNGKWTITGSQQLSDKVINQ